MQIILLMHTWKRHLAMPLLYILLVMPAMARGHISIIPAPLSLQEKEGVFIWNNKTIVAFDNKDLQQSINLFLKQVNAVNQITNVGNKTPLREKNVFYIRLNKTANPAIGNEGYTLSVKPGSISLWANTPAGIFYGLQTLLQLVPPAVLGNGAIIKTFDVPCAEITDYPRFGWRGLMLDASRHFFKKEDVKKYIDEMARYKYNIFHWHLTDDNGWRIEIKSLNRLTDLGSCRVPRTGRWGVFAPAAPGEKPTDGGYYTQEDIAEVIQYAKQRYITILPEIDVPAHCLALIAAFPNLSCTQLQYNVNPGSNFYTKEDNALCIGNDSVLLLLDKIFTEVARLFPCQYIHIGGDEAYKGFWEKCPKCRKRIANEHLSNTNGLQSYFIKKIEKMLAAKGKKMIGWDDIMDGGLAPGATIMSWRGTQGGIQAAKMNHPVIMAPTTSCYLDLYQGDPANEPPTYGVCRLSNAYGFEPVPDGVASKYIMGCEGALWSESVSTLRHAEYMTWPRGLALAEVSWSPKSSRNWEDFILRMEATFPRLDAQGIKYSRSVYNAIIIPQTAKNADSLQVLLSTELKGIDIYYTFDQSRPDQYYPKYKNIPLAFPPGAGQLNIITYRNGKPIGEQISIPKYELLRRLKG